MCFYHQIKSSFGKARCLVLGHLGSNLISFVWINAENAQRDIDIIRIESAFG